MRTMEGIIEIDQAEFWEFIMKFAPNSQDNIVFGVPRFNNSNGTVEIDFAASSDGSPEEWVSKPKVSRQWEEYYKREPKTAG